VRNISNSTCEKNSSPTNNHRSQRKRDSSVFCCFHCINRSLLLSFKLNLSLSLPFFSFPPQNQDLKLFYLSLDSFLCTGNEQTQYFDSLRDRLRTCNACQGSRIRIRTVRLPSPTLLVTQRVLKHRSSFPSSHSSFLTLSLPVRRFSFLRILR
jgi:hypothetical protein